MSKGDRKYVRSLCAVAVIAFGAPMREKHTTVICTIMRSCTVRVCAAMRKASCTRLTTERVLELLTLPPVTRLPGHRP